MKFKGMKQAGFSLVELMVVVGIIGILAAIAVPKLQIFTAKAKQSEARTNLRSIDTLQQAYFAENGTYNTAALVGADKIVWKFYTALGFPTAAANTFTISATSNSKLCPGDTDTDTWTINQESTLSNSLSGVNGC